MEVIPVFWCNEAWPAYADIFPEPFIYRPGEQDKNITGRNIKFAGRNIVLPPISVYSIPNGYIFPKTGLIADASGRLLIESSRSYKAIQRRNGGHLLRRMVDMLDEDGPTTVINVEADRFYYHWMIDVIPRLYALGCLNERVVLLLPAAINQNQLKLLKYCLPDNVQLRQMEDLGPVQAKQVLLSPVTSIQGVGIIRPELLSFLRRSILPKCELKIDSKRNPRRVYISREKTDRRRIINEDELTPILNMYKIQKIYVEDLTIEEQIRLFRDVELIVSPHGGGLTNMIFADDCVVVEIFPNGERPPWNLPVHYWGLAMSCGHHYRCLFHRNEGINVDFRIDTERLKPVLDEAVADLEVKAQVQH